MEEFTELWLKARENENANRKPELIAVKYEAELQEKLLKLTGVFTILSRSTYWQELPLQSKGMAVLSATINDQPALLARDNHGPLLFLNEAGTLTLKVEYAIPIHQTGSDQMVNFTLPDVPSGALSLKLPAGKRLLANTQQMTTLAETDDQQTFQFPVGNQTDWTFRITEENGDSNQDRLFLANSKLTVFSKAAEISWTATTQLEVFGQSLNVVTCSVPGHMEVMSVTSSGLDSWELADDPLNPKRTQIKLNYRQGINGKREVTIQGVTTTDTEGRWLFPNLIVNDADSQLGEITLGYAPPWKVRVESLDGVRRKSFPGELTSTPSRFGRALYFDIWRPDFELRLQNETSKSSYQAALASVLSISEEAVQFQNQLTLEATGAELFEFEFILPANWELESIRTDATALSWKTLMAEPGWQRIQVPLNKVLAPGETISLEINSRLVDALSGEAHTITLPQLELPAADLVEGTLLIKGAPVTKFNTWTPNHSNR
ncbi:MAG: hypothetical protein R3C11_08135 [Planctomycetaceae bacterium]